MCAETIQTLPRHGGDVAAAQSRWGCPAQGWLDLSTGINPFSYPLPSFAPEAWARLPCAAEVRALREAAAAAYGAPGPDWVLPAPGTGALIQWLPRVTPRGRVAILGPTYAEHAAAWAQAGHVVTDIANLEGFAGSDVAIVVNPNNPDGRTVAPAVLKGLAPLVVVDEAFADTQPACSSVAELETGMLVLRSFGKFYGLAGVRLGFAIAPPKLLEGLAAAMGPWSVSGPALALGAAALADREWAGAMRDRLAGMAERLDGVLAQAGLNVIGGTSLFRLVRHDLAHELYDRLGRAGILVRAFTHRPDILRFGLPGDSAALERLRGALCFETAAGLRRPQHKD